MSHYAKLRHITSFQVILGHVTSHCVRTRHRSRTVYGGMNYFLYSKEKHAAISMGYKMILSCKCLFYF